ncbi:vitamin-D-receptor interacting mediator subunit 4-domain-containing protein [Nemania serpens]|nr:vitamin-D-receptor interacting mediator subunit 4-domain-containing protein [Nemania serpens]
MNKQLDACFDRVEKALGTLIDSIAKYNPSTNQVLELGNADVELSRGLKDLQTHQSNYLRIQDLRASTARHDAQIRDTLRLLANTRKELVHATATVFPDGPNYEIQYDELLSYARRISKTTIPPVGAVNAIAAITESSNTRGGGGVGVGGGGEASAPDTAATTPAGGTPNGMTTPQPQPQALNATTNGDISQQMTIATTTGGSGSGSGTELPEPLASFLNPHSAYTFVPWPSEEQVRQGAVASLAYLAEQGTETEGYDPEAEKARKKAREDEEARMRDEEGREREERERRVREEQQARFRAEQEQQQQQQQQERREKEDAESWRRGSVSAAGGAGAAGTGARVAPAQSQPKAQFQFMGDDDDDDDD